MRSTSNMRTGLRVVHQASGLSTRHIVPLLSPRLARQPGRLIVAHIASCTAASPWPSCLVLESTQTQIEPHVRLQLLVSTYLENYTSLSVSFSMTISKALCSHGICNTSEAISSLGAHLNAVFHGDRTTRNSSSTVNYKSPP